MAHTMDMSGTKWEIFQAAVNLFAREGFHNVSVNQIAAEVGIRASSIYNHFSCKDALLEQMYEYYEYYISHYRPGLDQILQEVETCPPHETLKKTVFHFPEPELQDNMDKILTVTAAMSSDVRAKLLIQKNFFTISERYYSTLLNRMMELDLIEPIDVAAFVMAFCCIAHSSALQMISARPVTIPFYGRMINQLFGCAKPKKK